MKLIIHLHYQIAFSILNKIFFVLFLMPLIYITVHQVNFCKAIILIFQLNHAVSYDMQGHPTKVEVMFLCCFECLQHLDRCIKVHEEHCIV